MQRFRRSALLVFAAGTVVLAAACGSGGGSTTTVTAGNKNTASSKVLTGAGSTLVYPLVSQWEPDYATKAGVTITYGAIGSGGGIDQITARAVDFGASDAPLSADQATACKGCLQIPWALGATVVTYNVKGVPNNLHLTGPVVADMFLGNITSWNDPKIKALNPGVSLPSTKVTPIYRSDGSGDSFVFSSYLSAVSPDFKSKVGASTQPPFSTGTGAAKNSGVAASVQSTDGAVGYVAISYIAADGLNQALIQNAAGKYVTPSVDTIKAAAM
jgi:phosphate transport system substrate-binding protein